MTASPPEGSAVDRAVIAAAHALQRLDPGPLAEVRRMALETAAPAFWRLAARHPETIARWPAEWIEIIRTLAILTPKGTPEHRPALHDPARRLGAVLCDGGDPAWPGPHRPGAAPEPVVSERRLAQFLAARGSNRTTLLVRTARALARTRRPEAGLDVRDIAWAVLAPGNAARIAEAFYRRLDRAEAAARKEETAA